MRKGTYKDYAFIVLFLFIFYLYFTRPIDLNYVLKGENVKTLSINSSNLRLHSETEHIKIDYITLEAEGVKDEIVKLLSSYNYSKRIRLDNFRLIHPRAYKAQTRPFVQMFLFMGDGVRDEEITVFLKGEVVIRDKNRIDRIYKVNEGERKLFDELLKILEEINNQ